VGPSKEKRLKRKEKGKKSGVRGGSVRWQRLSVPLICASSDNDQHKTNKSHEDGGHNVTEGLGGGISNICIMGRGWTQGGGGNGILVTSGKKFIETSGFVARG